MAKLQKCSNIMRVRERVFSILAMLQYFSNIIRERERESLINIGQAAVLHQHYERESLLYIGHAVVFNQKQEREREFVHYWPLE